jgi:hypothetical protein
MDKASLKKVIKPLIKECLKEVLVEEGLIKIVKEHNIREQTERRQVLPETKPIVKKLQNESVQNKQQTIKEFKKSLAPVLSGFDPFAGTQNIDQIEEKQQEGVDINKLFDNNMVNSWNQQLDMIQGKKE